MQSRFDDRVASGSESGEFVVRHDGGLRWWPRWAVRTDAGEGSVQVLPAAANSGCPILDRGSSGVGSPRSRRAGRHRVLVVGRVAPPGVVDLPVAVEHPEHALEFVAVPLVAPRTDHANGVVFRAFPGPPFLGFLFGEMIAIDDPGHILRLRGSRKESRESGAGGGKLSLEGFEIALISDVPVPHPGELLQFGHQAGADHHPPAVEVDRLAVDPHRRLGDRGRSPGAREPAELLVVPGIDVEGPSLRLLHPDRRFFSK